MDISKSKYETYIESNIVTRYLNRFVNSYLFIFIIGLLVLLSSCFAIEVICFPIIALLGFIALLVSKDTKALIPIVLTFLMGMSYKNGLSYNPNPDIPNIYDNKAIGIFFLSLMILVIIGGIINQFLFKQYKNSWKRTLLVLPGIICLSIGYLLSGITTQDYLKNFIYTLSNVAMILAIFIFFSQTSFSDKDKKTSKYISIVMLMSALLIGLEVIHIYLTKDIIVDGTINKWAIENGWGIHNNFSGYLVISFPFVLYLLLTEDKHLKYYLFLLLIVIFNVLTLSRNGLLLMLIEIITGLVLICIYKKKDRRILLPIVVIVSIISIILIVTYKNEIYKLFKVILDLGTSLNGRDSLFKQAIEAFIRNPIFGDGWFFIQSNAPAPSSFAPNYKVHNILLQLLGSTGVIGLIGFILFTTNISVVTFKNINKDKLLFFMGIITLMLISIFDNFFFDYGFERYLAIFLVGIAGCDDINKIALND